jgi:transcriptional regulator with XRE-family HTH domain
LYNFIFFTNVLRVLDEKGLKKNELSEKSGVSVSFLSDLTTGKGNPSLKVMEAIADALETPLPLLLQTTDVDQEILAAKLSEGKFQNSIPPGHELVCAILPEYRAFIVKQWAEEARKKLHEK